MKKIIVFFSIIMIPLFLGACTNQVQIAPSDEFKDYNETAENYFLAYVEEDYYTMKKYLPDELIQGDYRLEEAQENDTPLDKETKENMGEYYGIYGFDYFYEDYGVIYYLIEFHNFRSGHPRQPLVFAIGKNDDKYEIQSSKYGKQVVAKHLEEVNNGDFAVSPMDMKKIIENYPEHSFRVKEYPEE